MICHDVPQLKDSHIELNTATSPELSFLSPVFYLWLKLLLLFEILYTSFRIGEADRCGLKKPILFLSITILVDIGGTMRYIYVYLVEQSFKWKTDISELSSGIFHFGPLWWLVLVISTGFHLLSYSAHKSYTMHSAYLLRQLASTMPFPSSSSLSSKLPQVCRI